MLILQRLQHLRIGRIAGFCLFLRRQAQLFKEYNPQLLCGEYVELLPGQGVYFPFHLIYAHGEPVGQLPEHIPVHREALPLHIIKHPGKRQFNLPVKLPKPLFSELTGDDTLQRQHGRRAFRHTPFSTEGL